MITALIILALLALAFGVLLHEANKELTAFIRRENERDGLDPNGRPL